jgi:hypothetical protein
MGKGTAGAAAAGSGGAKPPEKRPPPPLPVANAPAPAGDTPFRRTLGSRPELPRQKPAPPPPSAVAPAPPPPAASAAAPAPPPPAASAAAPAPPPPAASAAAPAPPPPSAAASAPKNVPAATPFPTTLKLPVAISIPPEPAPSVPPKAPSIAPALFEAAAPTLDIDATDLQSAFDNLFSDGDNSGPASLKDPDADRANLELFAAMAAEYARQVRHFMLELSVGDTSKQWVEVVRPALAMIREAAVKLDQTSLAEALTRFRETLEEAVAGGGERLAGAVREQLLDQYKTLSELLPSAFEYREEREQREPLLVHLLLRQTPDIHKLTIDKVYAAGLSSLEALCRMKPRELCEVAHVTPERAEAIARHFKKYWEERTRAPESPQQIVSKLEQAMLRLTQAQSEFLCGEAEEDRGRKRRARSERQAQSIQINVLLTELGEVGLSRELERCSVETKLERLREFLERRRQTAAAPF